MSTKLPQISKIAAIASVFSLLLVPSASAQNQSSNSGSGVGLEITSPLYQFTVEPGKNVQDIIKIKNVGPKETTYFPLVRDFKANNEDGTPVFLLEEEDENGTYSLTKWVHFTTEKITIAPNESAAFNFNVSVPADAEPGGHYGGILFSTEPGKLDGTGLSIQSVVGSLLLVRVAGDANESAQIKEFKTDKQVYDATDVDFGLTISNNGNVHVQPKGVVTIKNIFGGKVALLDVNQASSNVLPGSDRKFPISWEDPGFKLGYYTANVTLTYGTESKTMTAQTSFWIIPWKTLLVALVILMVILVLLVTFIKKYNAWVVAKASKSNQEAK